MAKGDQLAIFQVDSSTEFASLDSIFWISLGFSTELVGSKLGNIQVEDVEKLSPQIISSSGEIIK